jgi:hypothetical protein
LNPRFTLGMRYSFVLKYADAPQPDLKGETCPLSSRS